MKPVERFASNSCDMHSRVTGGSISFFQPCEFAGLVPRSSAAATLLGDGAISVVAMSQDARARKG